MAFKKGKSGNPSGRKKGSKNKATILLEERRDEAYKLVETVLEFVAKEMKEGDKQDKLRAIDKLSGILPFVIPKMASVEANINARHTVSQIIFEEATEHHEEDNNYSTLPNVDIS